MTDMPEVAMDVKGLCEKAELLAQEAYDRAAIKQGDVLSSIATALQSLAKELAEARAERDEARRLLGRCRTVLGNMAQENEGAIFNRWPIHHEPLRSDARNLLPLIDKEIGHEG